MGRAKESPGPDMRAGKLAKKLTLEDHPSYEFPKKQIYANGQLITSNMWSESQRAYIQRAVASL